MNFKQRTKVLINMGFVHFMHINLSLLTYHRQMCHDCNIKPTIVEGESFCAIQWGKATAKAPWKLAGVVDEILDLARRPQVTFFHIDHSANLKADHLAKEGASHPVLLVNMFPL